MPFTTTEPGYRIKLPSGDYHQCRTDDLKKELNAAALRAGLTDYTVFIDGNEVCGETELQTNSVAAVNAEIRIAPVLVPAK